jgi:hypothetical protein
VAVDSENGTDVILSTNDSPSNPFQLPSSPVCRSRGRPRRQVPIVSSKVPALEPIRKLRSGQDNWAKLSKAPALTPLSPKKNHQTRTMQGQRPVNSILLVFIYNLLTTSHRH